MYLNKKNGECDEQCLESNTDVPLHFVELFQIWVTVYARGPWQPKIRTQKTKDKKTREIQDGAEFWIKSAAPTV